MNQRIRSLIVPWLIVALPLSGCAALNNRGSSMMPSWLENSNKADAKLAYARLCERHGQTKQAEDLYRMLCQCKNAEIKQSAFHRLGVMAAKRSDYDQAHEQFQKAVAVKSPSAELLNDMGYNFYLMDNLVEAETCFREAMRKDPQFTAAHTNLGLALGQQGKFDEAMKVFNKSGSESQAHANMAYVYAQHRHLDQARHHYLKALSYDDTNKSAAEGLLQVAKAVEQAKKILGSVDKASEVATVSHETQTPVAAPKKAEPAVANVIAPQTPTLAPPLASVVAKSETITAVPDTNTNASATVARVEPSPMPVSSRRNELHKHPIVSAAQVTTVSPTTVSPTNEPAVTVPAASTSPATAVAPPPVAATVVTQPTSPTQSAPHAQSAAPSVAAATIAPPTVSPPRLNVPVARPELPRSVASMSNSASKPTIAENSQPRPGASLWSSLGKFKRLSTSDNSQLPDMTSAQTLSPKTASASSQYIAPQNVPPLAAFRARSAEQVMAPKPAQIMSKPSSVANSETVAPPIAEKTTAPDVTKAAFLDSKPGADAASATLNESPAAPASITNNATAKSALPVNSASPTAAAPDKADSLTNVDTKSAQPNVRPSNSGSPQTPTARPFRNVMYPPGVAEALKGNTPVPAAGTRPNGLVIKPGPPNSAAAPAAVKPSTDSTTPTAPTVSPAPAPILLKTTVPAQSSPSSSLTTPKQPVAETTASVVKLSQSTNDLSHPGSSQSGSTAPVQALSQPTVALAPLAKGTGNSTPIQPSKGALPKPNPSAIPVTPSISLPKPTAEMSGSTNNLPPGAGQRARTIMNPFATSMPLVTAPPTMPASVTSAAAPTTGSVVTPSVALAPKLPSNAVSTTPVATPTPVVSPAVALVPTTLSASRIARSESSHAQMASPNRHEDRSTVVQASHAFADAPAGSLNSRLDMPVRLPSIQTETARLPEFGPGKSPSTSGQQRSLTPFPRTSTPGSESGTTPTTERLGAVVPNLVPSLPKGSTPVNSLKKQTAPPAEVAPVLTKSPEVQAAVHVASVDPSLTKPRETSVGPAPATPVVIPTNITPAAPSNNMASPTKPVVPPSVTAPAAAAPTNSAQQQAADRFAALKSAKDKSTGSPGKANPIAGSTSLSTPNVAVQNTSIPNITTPNVVPASVPMKKIELEIIGDGGPSTPAAKPAVAPKANAYERGNFKPQSYTTPGNAIPGVSKPAKSLGLGLGGNVGT